MACDQRPDSGEWRSHVDLSGMASHVERTNIKSLRLECIWGVNTRRSVINQGEISRKFTGKGEQRRSRLCRQSAGQSLTSLGRMGSHWRVLVKVWSYMACCKIITLAAVFSRLRKRSKRFIKRLVQQARCERTEMQTEVSTMKRKKTDILHYWLTLTKIHYTWELMQTFIILLKCMGYKDSFLADEFEFS